LVQKLTAAEDFYFFTNLSYDLELLSVRLTKMSASEIESTLKDFIISRKFTSINQALIPVINYFTTSQNPDLDQLLAAIQKDLKPIAYKIINNRINKSNLNSYIQTLTSKALQKSASANSLQLLLETFTAEMIEAAKKIKSYLDESTPATSLPLDQKALVRALKSSISAISTPVQSRIYILVNEPDFAIQKQIWSGIESSLNANIKRFGVKCEPIGFTAQISNWSRGLFQNEKTKLEREAAQRDCDLANVVGSALGLKRENQFGEFADVHATLAQKMSADDLNVFVKNYREELTFDLFTEFQMLNADINKKQKLYDVLAESISVESSLPLVKENIEKSIAPLNATLKTVSASRSVKDLDFIIKRTKIINALLGENDLSTLSTSLNGYNALGSNISDIMESRGFVFPNLIEYHKKIQTEMINNEEINDQVYEEFLTANIYISMGVIGGWAAQHFLGVLPRWMGGPSIAGLIHNVGSKTINLIDGHGWFLMGLIGGHIGTLELKKNDFKTGLKHINDLTQSETLKPEGAENPLPLIEWSDYQQQLRYYTEGIHAANMNQLMDLGWLTFPFMMNRAIQHGTKRMTDGLGRKNEKFQVQSFKQRGFYEIRTRMSLNHKMKLMRSSFKDIKNPRSLDLTELQIGRDLALREARTAAEKIRINQSYDKIILEFGSRLERVIDHPAILESYSRAMFGNSGTISQAHRFYEEFRAIALKARQII
ncbi:MAG: hypothetical protein KDD38_05950, partial [Bdellovibrionales bacterium]|nr:hypothetical protein [Bdellovibrionales bacterium]